MRATRRDRAAPLRVSASADRPDREDRRGRLSSCGAPRRL